MSKKTLRHAMANLLPPGSMELATTSVDSLRALTAPEKQTGDDFLERVSLDSLVDNPYQPRFEYDQTALEELAGSIRDQGLLQPIVVTRYAGKYCIVVGHRRTRAVRLLGWEAIPALVRTVTEEQLHLLALMENIQREELHPVEKAVGFARFAEKIGSQAEAAKCLNVNYKTFNRWVAVTALGDDFLEKCRSIPDISLRNLHKLLAYKPGLREAVLNAMFGLKEEGKKKAARKSGRIEIKFPFPKFSGTCSLAVKAAGREHLSTSELVEILERAIAELRDKQTA